MKRPKNVMNTQYYTYLYQVGHGFFRRKDLATGLFYAKI